MSPEKYDQRGAAAIAFMQGMAEIHETPETATAGWARLSTVEQASTVGIFDLLGGDEVLEELENGDLRVVAGANADGTGRSIVIPLRPPAPPA